MTRIVRALDAGSQQAIVQTHTRPFHICDLTLPSGTLYLSEGPQIAFDNGTGSHNYLEGRVAVQELSWDGEGEQRCSLEFPNDSNTSASWFLTNKLANATVTLWLVHALSIGTYSTPVKYISGSCDSSELTPETLRVVVATQNASRRYVPNQYMGSLGFNHIPHERAVVFWNSTTFVLERDFG